MMHFIEPELTEINEKMPEPPASYIRYVFHVEKGLKKASLQITALGVYKAYINGKAVDEQVLLPGFTDYSKRVQAQEYDITDFLAAGENVIGCVLGDGWYRGILGAFNKRCCYGNKTRLAVKMTLSWNNGKTEIIETSPEWKATQDGPLRENNLKTKERYDATKEFDWQNPMFDDSNWHNCLAAEYTGKIIPHEGEKILKQEQFSPVVLHTPDGGTVLDFGQNMAGFVHFTVNGYLGDKAILVMGETLDKDGNFTLYNIQGEGNMAKKMMLGQRLEYILKDGTQEYEPFSLISGFRYAKVEAWPEEVQAENFKAFAVYSDMKPAGEFSCSDPRINRLFENVKWSMKSNFVDIPTDCPQRERAGWAGDINVFNEMADYLHDTRRFLKKWLHDFIGMQKGDGGLPYIVPYVPMIGVKDSSTGWSDAIVTIPMMQYLFYGDRECLEEAYPAAKKWVDFNVKRARHRNWLNMTKNWYREKYILDTGFHFGEWLEPGGSNAKDGLKAFIHPDYEVATAWFYYSADLLAQMAGILGKAEDKKKYSDLAAHIKTAYQTYFLPVNTTLTKRQCKYVRPLYMGLAPKGESTELAAQLNDLVISKNYCIGTGFLTTYQILNVLTDYGYLETAYKMLQNEACPGWLYEVKKGATTVWEGWNAIEEDGKINTFSMNHYSPGAAMSWLFSRCAGIRPEAPGFTKIRIQPYPGGGLTSASASYKSVSGEISSA